MTYIGIDPGKNGAMAVLKEDRTFRIVPYGPQSYADELEFSEADCIVCTSTSAEMEKRVFHHRGQKQFHSGVQAAVPYR